MRIVGVTLLVGLAGCAKTSTVTCGDLTCAPGSVCSPSGTSCTTKAHIDACFEADTPETTCTAPGVDRGVCRDGFCQAIVCGDNRMDPGEMCDDANTLPGDGCSSDCTSNEMCGNTVLDRGTEECDDGNVAAHDGCNTTCRNESPIWREVVDTAFTHRAYHTMAYDSVRKRVVMFGGRAGTTNAASNETWEFDGDTWTRRTPATSPPPRTYAAMAYDSARQKTVLYGGFDPSHITLGDLWEWDGTTWTERVLVGTPTARAGALMGYDPIRNKLVLYGGDNGSTYLNEVWELSGANWTSTIGIAGSPGNNAYRQMVFDPNVGGLVTFGPGNTSDMVSYDGTEWAVLPLNNAPPRIRKDYMLVYDASAGHTVLIGGVGAPASTGTSCGVGTNCNDAFEFQTIAANSHTWIPISAPFAPTSSAAAYDTDTGQLVVMGGLPAGAFVGTDATWTRKSSVWSLLEAPGRRQQCQVAYLPSLGGSVVFGGETAIDGTGRLADTWLLKDDGPQVPPRWSRIRPTTSPPTTVQTAMVLDRARGTLVLVDQTGATWEFDGTNWTKITSATLTPARIEFGMVYDEKRAAVVLFGGVQSDNTEMADTWIYNGTTWTELSASPTPPARHGFAMSYDAARDAIVVFGGKAGSTNDTTTWELKGTSWTQSTSTGPSGRIDASLVYDPVRKSSVLFSGAPASTMFADDTWEYLDGTWKQVTTVGPPPRTEYCATYDEAVGKVLVVSGAGPTGPIPDSWLFGYE